jgi:hydroxymethylbilane synthase
LGTRGSALALWQAEMVAARLRSAEPGAEVEIVIIRTTGDARQDVALREMAGKGIFVREIEAALFRGEIDLAVHSAKDLPSTDPEGLLLAAFCERADPRDAVISHQGGLDALPGGALVATSAPRRIAQLKHHRPDLRFTEMRGNVDTRLAKLERGEADALILACAGLDRLGRGDVISERLPLTVSLPQVGQGCVAVQCRADDAETIGRVRTACDHTPTRTAVTVERDFLALLGGGCTAPVAAHAYFSDKEKEEGTLMLTARVGSPDGASLLTASAAAPPDTIGSLAPKIFANLMGQGAAELL